MNIKKQLASNIYIVLLPCGKYKRNLLLEKIGLDLFVAKDYVGKHVYSTFYYNTTGP